MLQIVSQFALLKALATCFAAWSIFLAANAQSGQADQSESSAIEEVVVTAEFRPVSSAEVPGSVSVLDPDANGDLINHLDELLFRAANVNLTSGASRARFFQIRGIGERSRGSYRGWGRSQWSGRGCYPV